MDASVSAVARDARRDELAQFLRAKRKSLQPQDAGLVVRRRRRASGLLREEVADLAGMSLTWYTWMEQGRATNPSSRVLEGLAAALRLDAAERRHLFRLARPDLDPARPAALQDPLTPAQRQWLHALAPHPAYALSTTWDVVDWNEPAARLFGGFAHLQGEARNLMHRLLLDPAWRDLFVDWESMIGHVVAQFRAMSVQYLDDARLHALIEGLLAASPHFARLWAQREVALPPTYAKTLRAPGGGTLSLHYATLRQDNGRSVALFTVYTPADAATAEHLRRLVD